MYDINKILFVQMVTILSSIKLEGITRLQLHYDDCVE